MACLVCDAEQSFERLTTMWSRRRPFVRLPVAICRTCGFVTVHPKPDPACFGRYNAIWFGQEVEEESASPHNRRKWETVLDRIGPHFGQGVGAVLDIGARWGDALVAMREAWPDATLAAIELVEEFHPHLRSIGAEVHEADIQQAMPEVLGGRFDLVIFRHTLEHMDEPLAALRSIAAALSPIGCVYIAVPNAMSRRKGVAMRTDWFRPVHGHYFNRQTLVALCGKAGLYPVACEAPGELWGLFCRDERYREPRTFTPDEQRRVLEQRLAGSRLVDARWIARSMIAGALRG